jgi:hypothetical protein
MVEQKCNGKKTDVLGLKCYNSCGQEAAVGAHAQGAGKILIHDDI